MKIQVNKKPYFIVFTTLFYLLFLTNEYYPMLTAKDLFTSASLWITGVSIILFILMSLKRSGLLKYALLIFYIELAFLFFGSFHDFLKNHTPALAHYIYIIPFLLLLGIVFIIRIMKSKTSFPNFFTYLNTLGIILVTIELIRCVAINTTDGDARFWFTSKKKDAALSQSKCDTCVKPDIYFLIFDEYTASRTLKDYWGYDNSKLDSFFLQNGFYYAFHSRSNYNSTPLSIGSILNMDYHPPQLDKKINLSLFCKGIASIEKNEVCNILIKNGYDIINHSSFPLPGQKALFSISFLIDKQEVILAQTLWGRFIADLAWQFPFLHKPQKNTPTHIEQARPQLSLVKQTYDLLLKTSSQPHQQPVFVYTHFFLPHEPYFFDSTGTITPTSTWYSRDQHQERYLSQLKYTNTLIMDIIASLKTAGDRPRVIIIQSDHGYRSFSNTPLIDGNDNSTLEFNNLNAIYLPDRDYRNLYDSISSVNTFGIVLNKYLHLQKPLLKDSTIYLRRN